MRPKAVGFYWTLPVPWAGFTSIGLTVDEAATRSRTIAYQRALIRRYVKDEGLELVHEQAFVELQPDRGSHYIEGDLLRAAAVCREHNAALLYVDFSHIQNWRAHYVLQDIVGSLEVAALQIPAEPTIVSGELFDPYAHFQHWGELQRKWMNDKAARASSARARALELEAAGMKRPQIAKVLNDEGLRSLSGRDWTGESLRKFLKSN